jgi:hypothetical protein
MVSFLVNDRRCSVRTLAWLFVAHALMVAVRPDEAVPCGTIPGAANFGFSGNELRAAASCFVLGTNCDSTDLAEDAKGSAATVEAYYGPIEDWCTGGVGSFTRVFQNMAVSCFRGSFE